MIEWVYGDSGMGKSTLAKKIAAQSPRTIILDGDDMRKVWTDLKYSQKDRNVQNLRVARLARILEMQGFNVVVSTICPTKQLRQQVHAITHCRFIHIESMQQDVKIWE